MNETIKKALSLNNLLTKLPIVDIGDILKLEDIWDGKGEVPEKSYSYLVTNKGDNGYSNFPIWINYEFVVIEENENVLNKLIKIKNIQLI